MCLDINTCTSFSCCEPKNTVPQLSTHPSIIPERYREMFSRLRYSEACTLKQTIEQLSDKEVKSQQLCTLLPNFKNNFFQSPNLPYYNLWAYLTGKIDEYQFGTLQLYWSIGQYHKGYDQLEVHSLFDNEQPNAQAVQWIRNNCKVKGEIEPIYWKFRFIRLKFLTDEQLTLFFYEMKKLPFSEQHFFIVPDLQAHSNSHRMEFQTVSQRIRAAGLNVFNRISTDHKDLRMIPSLGMMQTLLKIKYGNESVKINPTLGLSSIKQLKKLGSRDMAIPFPKVDLPGFADTFPAPGYDFPYHDFYHAILASSIPIVFRRLMLRVADIALGLMRENKYNRESSEGHTLRSLCTAAIDMEATYFQTAKDIHDDQYLNDDSMPAVNFWSEIQQLSPKAFSDVSYHFFDAGVVSLFYQRVAQKIIIEKEGLLFNLTSETLEKAISTQPQTQEIKPLEIMLNYVTSLSKGLVPKNIIRTGLKTIIAGEKIIQRVGLKAARLAQSGKLFDQELLKKLAPNNDKFKSTQLALFVLLGFPIAKLTTLCSHQINLILENIRNLTILFAAGVSFEQIMNLNSFVRAEILTAAKIVATFLEYGISWDQIINLPNLKHFSKYKVLVSHFLTMGATYEETLNIFYSGHYKLYRSKERNLTKLINLGMLFKYLKNRSKSLVESILNSTLEIENLLRQGIHLEALFKLNSEKLDLILRASSEVILLLQAGFLFEQLILLNNETLSLVLTNSLNIIDLIKTGISIEQLIKLEYLKKITKYSVSINRLLVQGFDFKQIMDADPNNYAFLIKSKSKMIKS